MIRNTFALAFLGFFLLTSCTQNTPSTPTLTRQVIAGETMGSTFSLVYLDSTKSELQDSFNMVIELDLEKLFLAYNNSVSTYNENSEISKFNQGDTILVDKNGPFARNFDLSKKVHKMTNGWFNPAVMPLVNYWGFGYKPKKIVTDVDGQAIKKILALVQFDSVQKEDLGNQYKIYKQKKGIELDFNAIAPGDAVDEVARLLESKGIFNYFIEIGGEIRANGKTISGHPWRTAVRTPKEGAGTHEAQRSIELSNMSLATSGNYENFHQDKEKGIKYAHTINPFTGFPEKNTLLSASVFTPDCGSADAYATAFMAMGLDKAFDLAQTLPNVEVYFIYSDAEGNLAEKYTKGAEAMFVK